MKYTLFIWSVLMAFFSFAQEKSEAEQMALNKANNLVFEGNTLIEKKDFVAAEMAYRKAISQKPSAAPGAYNLGTSLYKAGHFNEALYRLLEASKTATSKLEKHKIFHNMGNILMENKKCSEAVDAYKNALKNNPLDDETRYNFAAAKACAKSQEENQDDKKDDKDKDKDDQKDKGDKDGDKDDNKDNKDKEGDNKEDNKQDNKEKEEQDPKDGEDKNDKKDNPQDNKEDKGKKGDKEKEQQPPKRLPGQLSPQQIKNLLEAMNNQEQKVQEKMNFQKQKGDKIKTDKDW